MGVCWLFTKNAGRAWSFENAHKRALIRDKFVKARKLYGNAFFGMRANLTDVTDCRRGGDVVYVRQHYVLWRTALPPLLTSYDTERWSRAFKLSRMIWKCDYPDHGM